MAGFALCLLWIPAAQAAAASDPFAGITESTAAAKQAEDSWKERLFHENFGFRKELMSEFAASEHARSSSRQSAGFEVLKKMGQLISAEYKQFERHHAANAQRSFVLWKQCTASCVNACSITARATNWSRALQMRLIVKPEIAGLWRA